MSTIKREKDCKYDEYNDEVSLNFVYANSLLNLSELNFVS